MMDIMTIVSIWDITVYCLVSFEYIGKNISIIRKKLLREFYHKKGDLECIQF